MRRGNVGSGRTTSTSAAHSKTIQVSLQASIYDAKSNNKTSKRWKDMTRAITPYIAKDMLPNQTIERSIMTFLHFSKPQLPNWNRSNHKNECINIVYQWHKKNLKEKLSPWKCFVFLLRGKSLWLRLQPTTSRQSWVLLSFIFMYSQCLWPSTLTVEELFLLVGLN